MSELPSSARPVASAANLGAAVTQPAVPSSSSGVDQSVSRPLSDEEIVLRDELTAALTRTHGNVGEVARAMGKTRMQIHRWMKRFDITPDSFR